MKPTRQYLKREGIGRGEWEYGGGVNLLNLYCTHAQIIIMKSPHIINASYIKNII
jgi:hypothetical protein